MEEGIFARIKTTESAQLLRDELELLLNSLYKGSGEFTSVLRVKVRAGLFEYMQNKLAEKDIDVEGLLKKLIDNLQNIPRVRLIIAYEPSEDAIDRFYSFITAVCHRRILLDIGYAPDIIGGAVVIYRGKYRDFSFKNIFEKEFDKERDKILKITEK